MVGIADWVGCIEGWNDGEDDGMLLGAVDSVGKDEG